MIVCMDIKKEGVQKISETPVTIVSRIQRFELGNLKLFTVPLFTPFGHSVAENSSDKKMKLCNNRDIESTMKIAESETAGFHM